MAWRVTIKINLFELNVKLLLNTKRKINVKAGIRL